MRIVVSIYGQKKSIEIKTGNDYTLQHLFEFCRKSLGDTLQEGTLVCRHGRHYFPASEQHRTLQELGIREDDKLYISFASPQLAANIPYAITKSDVGTQLKFYNDKIKQANLLENLVIRFQTTTPAIALQNLYDKLSGGALSAAYLVELLKILVMIESGGLSKPVEGSMLGSFRILIWNNIDQTRDLLKTSTLSLPARQLLLLRALYVRSPDFEPHEIQQWYKVLNIVDSNHLDPLQTKRIALLYNYLLPVYLPLAGIHKYPWTSQTHFTKVDYLDTLDQIIPFSRQLCDQILKICDNREQRENIQLLLQQRGVFVFGRFFVLRSLTNPKMCQDIHNDLGLLFNPVQRAFLTKHPAAAEIIGVIILFYTVVLRRPDSQSYPFTQTDLNKVMDALTHLDEYYQEAICSVFRPAFKDYGINKFPTTFSKQFSIIRQFILQLTACFPEKEVFKKEDGQLTAKDLAERCEFLGDALKKYPPNASELLHYPATRAANQRSKWLATALSPNEPRAWGRFPEVIKWHILSYTDAFFKPPVPAKLSLQQEKVDIPAPLSCNGK